MRLMNIPLNYTLVGDQRAVQKQIGNALPPGMAASLASNLLLQVGLTAGPAKSATAVQPDGGRSTSSSDDTTFEIESGVHPWWLASTILSLLQEGTVTTLNARGPQIAAALDVAELARRQFSKQVQTEFTEWTEDVDEGKCDALSVIELKLKP
jgi:DNA-binding protein